jgi:hypothetical protein
MKPDSHVETWPGRLELVARLARFVAARHSTVNDDRLLTSFAEDDGVLVVRRKAIVGRRQRPAIAGGAPLAGRLGDDRLDRKDEARREPLMFG